jgi:hypothetical protein
VNELVDTTGEISAGGGFADAHGRRTRATRIRTAASAVAPVWPVH